MKTIIKIALILSLAFLITGCSTLFKEDPKLIGYVEKENRTAITYYDNGEYVTYYYVEGTLTRIVKDNIWGVKKSLK